MQTTNKITLSQWIQTAPSISTQICRKNNYLKTSFNHKYSMWTLHLLIIFTNSRIKLIKISLKCLWIPKNPIRTWWIKIPRTFLWIRIRLKSQKTTISIISNKKVVDVRLPLSQKVKKSHLANHKMLCSIPLRHPKPQSIHSLTKFQYKSKASFKKTTPKSRHQFRAPQTFLVQNIRMKWRVHKLTRIWTYLGFQRG